jgi:hypothetical protein
MAAGIVGAAATPLALVLGAISLATGSVAQLNEPNQRRANQFVAVMRARRPRRFGARGELLPYGPGAVDCDKQRLLDARAALAVQRRWRQRRSARLAAAAIAVNKRASEDHGRGGGPRVAAAGCCVVM